MSNENLLIYPTVDLFVYDLAQGVGQDEVKVNENRLRFWQKIYGPKISTAQLKKFKQAETANADYIELLGTQLVQSFESLDGYAYPVRIGDIYAGQFDLSGKIELDEKKRFAPKEIDCIKAFKAEIISRINPPAKIGQSWLVWGQLTADDQDALTTAKNCYEALNVFPINKWDRDLKATGQFAGADFYELWMPPSDRSDIDRNYHVLICLFPYKSGQPIKERNHTISKLYPHLLRLFAYRNKIIWVYAQSRQLKIELEKVSENILKFTAELPELVNSGNISHKNLHNLLAFVPTYTLYVNILKDHESTIKNSLSNYEKRLKSISEQLQTDDKDFEFMLSFSAYATEKYVWQVEHDNRILSEKLQSVVNTIQAIQSLIEIEKTKSNSPIAWLQNILKR